MKSMNFLGKTKQKHGLCKVLMCEEGIVREPQIHATKNESESVWGEGSEVYVVIATPV